MQFLICDPLNTFIVFQYLRNSSQIELGGGGGSDPLASLDSALSSLCASAPEVHPVPVLTCGGTEKFNGFSQVHNESLQLDEECPSCRRNLNLRHSSTPRHRRDQVAA